MTALNITRSQFLRKGLGLISGALVALLPGEAEAGWKRKVVTKSLKNLARHLRKYLPLITDKIPNRMVKMIVQRHADKLAAKLEELASYPDMTLRWAQTAIAYELTRLGVPQSTADKTARTLIWIIDTFGL